MGRAGPGLLPPTPGNRGIPARRATVLRYTQLVSSNPRPVWVWGCLWVRYVLFFDFRSLLLWVHAQCNDERHLT